MKQDSKDLEAKLQGRQASELDGALLDRLEAAAEGTLTELGPEELKLEAQLRAIRPRALSEQLLKDLEAQVEGLPAPTQVRVLPFPGQKTAPARKQRSWYGAAAAVALLGALCALWFDPAPVTDEPVAGDPITSPGLAVGALPKLPNQLPAEFTRALSETRDQGIIWPANEEPHRVLKVVYTDRVSMKREDGSTYEVEQPRVEYYLVPTESH